MKLRVVLIGLFLLVGCCVFSQSDERDSLVERYYKYPKEALKEAEMMYEKAVKEKDKALLIRAVVVKTTFSLVINNEEFPQLIAEVEQHIAEEKDVRAKSILHSYVGELYCRYYNGSRYRIDERGNLTGGAPKDMESWSKQQFHEKIIFHFLASVDDGEVLQQAPVSDYRMVLIEGSSDSLRPTLYDFLCYRAFDVLSRARSLSDAPDLIFSPDLLKDLDVFLKVSLASDFSDVISCALKIWQDFLFFQVKCGDTNSLLMADLGRLVYFFPLCEAEGRDSIYLSALRGLKGKYAGNPMVVEVMAKEANLLCSRYSVFYFSPSTQDRKAGNEAALAICEEGVRMYPGYNRINLLREIVTRIKTPEMRMEFPKVVYPGEPLSLKISSRNIGRVNVSLYRVLMDATRYQDEKAKGKKAVVPKRFVCARDYSLVSDVVYRDSTLFVDVPESGLYEVVCQVEGAKESSTGDFICTQIFSTYSRRGEEVCVEAYDWQSGRFVTNAKVLFYQWNYGKKFQVLDSAYTNSSGMVSWKPGKEEDGYFFYQVSQPENPACYPESIGRFYSSDGLEDHTELVTDRKVYRPGQTIYFKGFCWQSTPDSLYVLNRKSQEVSLRDATYKEIKRQSFISNSFGSFSGSFVIPRETLNGVFTLKSEGFHTTIVVADYKRPEFEVVFKEPQGVYYAGDTIGMKGCVKSFSGVPVANTAIAYELSAGVRLFDLSLPINKNQGGCYTDVNGEFEVKFVAKQPRLGERNQGSFFYQVKASLTDSKGETQEGAVTIRVLNRSSKLIAISPIVSEQVNRDKKSVFRIQLNSDLVGSTPRMVHYSLARLRAKSLSEVQDSTVEKVVLQGEMKISQSDSLFPDLRGLSTGAYLFSVECEGSRASRIFYLYSNADKRPPVATYDWLVEEKTSCLPGEKARIRFGTSARNAYVRYQVYSQNKLLLEQDVVLSDEIMDIEVPFSASYGHQIWVYITYVKDKQYIEKVVPIRRIREERKLAVEMCVFRDKLEPGEEEEWEIRVTDSRKRPVDAELLAMMYDSSLDKFRAYPFDFKADYSFFPFPFGKQGANRHREFDAKYLWRHDFRQHDFESPSFDFSRLDLFERVMYQRINGVKTRMMGEETGESSLTLFSTEAKGAMLGKNSISYDMLESSEESVFSSPVALRQNFQETAFFYPHLRTDSTGKVFIRFKVPEALTKWRFIALATTRDMANQFVERYITTSKALMVRPNLPRFLRSGDEAEIQATVSNISDSLQEGVVSFELFTVDNGEVIDSRSERFRVMGGRDETVGFRFKVPASMDMVGCRIVAKGNGFSDGEQHLLPILPDETLITESLPIYATTSGEHSFSLTPSVTKRRDYRLTLELASNPIWYAVLALPSLQEAGCENVTDIGASFYVNTLAAEIVGRNPKVAEVVRQWDLSADAGTLQSRLEQNQELKSILLSASPWVTEAQNETERMRMLAGLFDQNRLAYLQEQALNKLAVMQTAEGGWSWFKGMNTSRFMTLNTLTIMTKAVAVGGMEYKEDQKRMQMRALRYLDQEIEKDFKRDSHFIGYDQIVYLYVRSLYRDVPLGDALDAHKHFMALARKQWSGFSLYEKAVIAIGMKNYGFSEEAKEVIQSLREYAVSSSKQGMFWPNNRNHFYRNSAIQVHTAMMEAFQQVGSDEAEMNRMKQWLLQQKQVQNWGGVPATVDAIHALVTTGDDLLNQSEELKVNWGKRAVQGSEGGSPLGYMKESCADGGFSSDMLTVKVEKESATPSWGGLYLQYFTKLERVKGGKTDLSVDKQLFLTKKVKGESVLSPLEKRELKVGDLVTVRLTLTLDRDMEFLHLKDLRAACMEPTEQLSGNQWRFGTMYYQEVEDAATHFFFTSLAKGSYVIEYGVRLNQAGNYQDGMATLQCVYAPEFSAFSKAGKVQVGQ